MGRLKDLARWVIRPSENIVEHEDRRKASLLSAFTFLFAMSMNMLCLLNLTGLLSSGAEIEILLYGSSVLYNIVYFFSRTKYYQLAGFLWLTYLVVACYAAIGTAASGIMVMTILLYVSLAISAAGLVLGIRLTLVLSLLVCVGVILTPQLTEYIDFNDVIPVLVYCVFMTLLTLSWKYIQFEHIRQIKDDAEIIDHQNAEIIQTSNLAAVGEIAGGIAHEINNPLAVIRGNVRKIQILIEKNRFDEVAKSVQSIDATCVRINNITKGMLTLCRTEKDMRWFDFKSVVEDALNLCSFTVIGENVDIRLEEELELEIHGDQTLVLQVIVNIVKNAIDAFPPEQENRFIKLGWTLEGGNVAKISILNNGAEIPRAIQNKILDPFFTTKGINKGTGLGLSISRKIMDEHGGAIDVSSSFEETIFILSFPNGRMKSDDSCQESIVAAS